jgi:hypothetical protein
MIGRSFQPHRNDAAVLTGLARGLSEMLIDYAVSITVRPTKADLDSRP